MLPPLAGGLAEAILARRDAGVLAQRARDAGMATVFERACEAVVAGQTDPAEVRRVLGFSREVNAED
jgi:type II secretory ATPase GspE/PulE/Tfp pilus assembly ATPase PilB-like protein